MSSNPRRFRGLIAQSPRRRALLATLSVALALAAPASTRHGLGAAGYTQSGSFVAERVADINPGPNGSRVGDMAVFKGSLYFSAFDGTNGDELWRLDANAAAPVRVTDLVPGPGSSNPVRLTVAGDFLYFGATTPASGFELWHYDGLNPPVLNDIYPGANSSLVSSLTAFGNQVAFRATNGTDGEEPWVFNAAAGPPQMFDLDDTCTPDCGSNPYGFRVYEGKLYFGAADPDFGEELHVYDGTSEPTRLTDGLSPSEFTGIGGPNGRLIYHAGLSVTQLRSRDLVTGEDIEIVLPSTTFFGANPNRFVAMNDLVYFTADDGYVIADGAAFGRELWVTDGTQQGTRMVDDVFEGPQGSNPFSLIPFNGELVFTAADAAAGFELRATTGVDSRLIADIAPGPANSSFDGFVEMPGALFFVSRGGGQFLNPWVTDGTSANTEVVRKQDGQLINPTGDSMDDMSFTPFNGALYFAASDGGLNFELWKIEVGGTGNQAPVASASAPPTATADGSCLASVGLDGSGSTDPDGDLLTYTWTENGSPIATGATPTVLLSVGTHTLRLTVTDPAGASDTADVTVTVSNAFQVSYIGPNPLQGGGSNTVQVAVTNGGAPVANAAVAVTVNGTPVQTTTDAAGIASVTVGPQPGTSVPVTIDFASACGAVTKTVTVPVNAWPTISPGATSPVFAGANCTASVPLSANASDLNGDTLTYVWSEGGATFSTAAAPTASLAPGVHTIDVFVSDGKGGSATGSVVIEVKKALTGLAFVQPLPPFTVGVSTSVSARLTDGSGAPIAGAALAFALAGGSANGTTDANGIATVNLTPGNNGIQELSVSYAGDTCREAVTFKTNVTVERPAATIIVQKIVINDNGGQLQAPAFSISVASPGDTKTIAGNATGVPVAVNVGAYSVTETPSTEYATSYSADCNGTTVAGDTKTCVITNNDRPGTLNVVVQIVRDSGGPAAVPGDVAVTVTGTAPSPSTFSGSAGTAVMLGAGAYSVASSQLTGYTRSTTGECAATMTLGGSKTCALIFDDDAPQQEPPTANNQSPATNEDTALPLQLIANDPDGDPLTYILVNGPASGVLTGTGAARVYTPNGNFNGLDSFTFKVNDGFADSNIATVSITVVPVNDVPTATPQTLTTLAGTPVGTTLTGSDVETPALTFAIATQPANGIVQLNGASVTYTPNAGFTGPDSFTFTASDGAATSAPAAITIDVRPLNAELSVVLADSPDPITIGQPLTYLARVFNNGPDIVPNPTLTFTLPAGVSYAPVGPCTLAATTLTCRPGAFGPGETPFQIVVVPQVTGQITASVYTPDLGSPDEAQNTSTTSTFVDKAQPTTTLSSAPAPSTFGQTVTFTATVTGYAATGLVTFSSDLGAIGTAPLVNGIATITTAALQGGQRTLVATYAGDGNNLTSTSAPLPHLVQRASSSTGLSSSVNPSTVGQLVTFTATVSGATPTGTVTFIVDGVEQPAALGPNRVASLTTSSLGAGSHTVVARYDGDTNYLGSQSGSLVQQVGKAATSVALVIQPNPAAPGTTVALIATVTGFNPTGSVTFLEGNTVLGTAAVTAGTATLVIPQGKKGSRQISASYPGDANNLASASPRVRLTTK